MTAPARLFRDSALALWLAAVPAALLVLVCALAIHEAAPSAPVSGTGARAGQDIRMLMPAVAAATKNSDRVAQQATCRDLLPAAAAAGAAVSTAARAWCSADAASLHDPALSLYLALDLHSTEQSS